MIILDGKKTSNDIKTEIAESVKEIVAKGSRPPHLAAVIVGDDGASLTYVGSKVRACKRVGFESTLIKLPETISENELLEKVKELNNDENIDGYIVQLPLPSHIDEDQITLSINPKKDVDGFHPENIGKMTLGLPSFLPATPNGIMEILRRYNISTEGKNTVVVIDHDMEFIRRLESDVTVLNQGTVLCEGKMEKIQTDPKVIEVYLGNQEDNK